MKYRELTPNEIEAYNIGYKVGNRQIVITDIEWESENEHKIYRKGYMAGLMDYKRNVSKVSSVSNVEIETSTTSITPTTPIGISIRNSIGNKEIGGIGGKEKEPVSKIDFDTTFKAGGQLWALPPNFRKLALTRYTESEIRAFEITHSCHESLEDVCLNDIKHEEPKPKKPEKKAYGEQQKVKLTDEEYGKLQELYGRRLDNAIDLLDGYIARQKKDPYASHYAVMRRNNWVYEKTFATDFVPLKPQVADMSKFVKAKPLGEEND